MYDIKNKQNNIDQLNKSMLLKTLSMFEYEGLPETIPHKILERIIQVNGYVFIAEHEGNLYPFTGALGGELDVYGEYTKIIVNNVALKLNKTFDIQKDGVLISNDDLKIGMMPLFNKMNYMLVENDINISMWGYNSRQQKIISANDDKTRISAEKYQKKIVDGELSVIGESAFLESLNVSDNKSSSLSVNDFIALHQYLKGSLFNEVGLSSSFNMKKERLITSEVKEGEDSIFALPYNMMINRIDGIKRLNEFFGLNVVVDFGSVWAIKNEQIGVEENDDPELETMGADSDRTTSIDIQTEEVEQEQERGRDGSLVPELDPVIDSDEGEADEVVSDEVEADEGEADEVESDEELEIDEERG